MSKNANATMVDLISASIAREYPEGQDGMKAKLDALGIEWHTPDCKGRHGVVRCKNDAAVQEAYRILIYFFGDKCAWRKDNNIEFNHQTKVFPPPKKPWEWCGETVLFKDWQKQIMDAKAGMTQFKLGDAVEFDPSRGGATVRGTVANFGRTRLTVVSDGAKWHVPANMLRHIEPGFSF